MTEQKKNNIVEESDKIYENLCKLYGEYFNYTREQKGLSLRELSKKTNISIALISLLENGDKRFIDAKINVEEMRIMLFTSGTTNQSKAVMLSQKNIMQKYYLHIFNDFKIKIL